MPGEDSRVSNSALKIEIKGLGEKLEEVKKLLVSNEERIRCLERVGDKTTPLIEKRLEILEKLTEAHAIELEELKDLITTQTQSITKLANSFETMQRIWKWALGIFTAVMIAVIIMLVTGKAMLVFK